MDAIVTYDLAKQYGSAWALRGLNLQVPQGSAVACVGRENSGKTTLIRLLSGLYRPTSGECTVLGLSPAFAPWLTGDTPEESRARVEAFDQLFRAAVSDTVSERMGGFAPAEPVPAPAFDRERLRGMSPREINAHWAEIQDTLKG